MSSPAESTPDAGPQKRSGGLVVFERWNRKLHFYSGVFMLFFLWLFAFTGLLLNHPDWTFHENWKNRHETTVERAIVAPGADAVGDLGQARDIMRQLGIDGEILWTTTRTVPSQFEFQVRRPRHFYFIKADWGQGKATLRQADVNAWGIMKVLHAFTGNVADDPRNRRDWVLTTVWSYSMDVVAAATIQMVLGGIYLWIRQPGKRWAGGIALGLGTLICGVFCVGLRWWY